ncbi:MAG: hypothetical protein HY855_05845 [Burkholderiales bacterium]|nr:hypothetical protein [Burkholderiales bacterium]
MNRTIIGPNDLLSADLHAGGGRPAPRAARVDGYVDKLLKLVPAEVVALWVSLRGILAAAQQVPAWLPWAAFVVLLALTPWYLVRVAKVAKPRQVAMCTGAFLVWAYSLGGLPFGSLPAPYYLPVYGAVLLPLYTFVLPLIPME